MNFSVLSRYGCMAALACVAGNAGAFDLPQQTLVRQPGLWSMEQTATLSDGTNAMSVRKEWQVCLNEKADRALFELEMREQQAAVAVLHEVCEDPTPVFNNGELTWGMQCEAPSGNKEDAAKSDIQYLAYSPAKGMTRSEIVVINSGSSTSTIGSGARFVTYMKRQGDCESGQSPGSLLLSSWKVNGEETLKGGQRGGVFQELEDKKTYIEAELKRKSEE